MKSSSERILQAIAKLVKHTSYDKITYADVAKEAGVHRSTIQRYFGSKENMRNALKKQLHHHSPADTKTKILDAARRVFARNGYDGATLDDVAKDAGLTKGAVYWHFQSKSELFLALCDRSLEQLVKGLPKQVHDVFASSNPVQALQSLLESEWSSCEKGNGEQPMLFLEFISGSRDSSVRERLHHSFNQLFEETATVLKDMQQKGYLSADADVRQLSVILHALVNGIVLMWLVAPNQVSFPSISAEASQLLWKGFQPDK